jgi:N-acetylmuramoyl-L-alanine amidase
LLLWLCAAAATPVSYAAEVHDLRLWRAPDHTRLVFDLSAGVEYKLFTLDAPERVVIDIADSSLATRLGDIEFEDSPITGLRSATRDSGLLRVVIDLNTKTQPKSFTLEPNAEQGHRLVVDLYDSSDERVATALSVRDGSERDKPERATNRVASNSAAPSGERRDIVVAISAGHGGEDPGGIGYDGKLQEKHITLRIARALYDYLDRMPGYAPVMVRDGDYYVKLSRRPEIARERRADLFVAVHTDWYKTSRARGLTIYALSGDRADRENARRVAQKENTADLLGGVGSDLSLGSWDDDVALTLVSLQMAWSMEQSVIAGSRVLDAVGGITRLRKTKVQQASLEVLKSPDIPSILIETGYLTNPEEAKRLNTSSFQKQLAEGIGRGVMAYFYDAPPEGSLVAWQKSNGVTPASYTVRRGDSLSMIAQRFGTTMAALKKHNSLKSDGVQISQVIKLPGGVEPAAREHKIQSGETLSGIAARYRVSLADLRRLNELRADRILVGQVLRIPAS